VLGVAQVARSVGPGCVGTARPARIRPRQPIRRPYKPAIRKIASTTQIGYMDYGGHRPVRDRELDQRQGRSSACRLQAERLQPSVPVEDRPDRRRQALRSAARQGSSAGQPGTRACCRASQDPGRPGLHSRIALYGGVGDPRPSIGAIYADAGTLQGQYLGKQAKKRAGTRRQNGLRPVHGPRPCRRSSPRCSPLRPKP